MTRQRSHDREIGQIPRRTFLGSALAAGTFLLKGVLPAAAATNELTSHDLKQKYGFKGRVLGRADLLFEKVASGRQWNDLLPKRRPDLIAEVLDVSDVVAAIKYARAEKIKVAVRGGGHNWCNPALRKGGLMIDLTKLDRVISVDPATRRAVLEPIVSNRDVQSHLNTYGMSYPTGHCPPVKLSGYLLSGGMSWNHGEWGPGVGSIESIEVVTAQGEVITASANENPDYFWAARGGGPGFFGVATKYTLKLYPLPKAITASVYFYPYELTVPIAKWLEPLAANLPSNVELSQFLVHAPLHLADKAKSSNGKLCMVTATMFADSAEEARKTLQLLETCPYLAKAVSRSFAQPTDFPSLFDASGSLWPGDLRCKVDACFSNASLADLLAANYDHFLTASPKTVLMYAVFTGKNVPPPTPADAAFSMTGRFYGGPWTMWEDPRHDAEEIAWHSKAVNSILPLTCGHYVSESDTTGHPEYAKASYKKENWDKLAALRTKYDPEGVFFDWTDGIDG